MWKEIFVLLSLIPDLVIVKKNGTLARLGEFVYSSYTAIATLKHCCCSQNLLSSYSYTLTLTYKLIISETDNIFCRL